jgi:hypothetical protein
MREKYHSVTKASPAFGSLAAWNWLATRTVEVEQQIILGPQAAMSKRFNELPPSGS